MRFIHTADLHIGMKPDKDRVWGFSRADAVRTALSRLISHCNEEEIDLLLIAGDLFHRPPTVSELREADALFLRLNHTKVVLIAGNHDHLRPGCAYADFAFSPNVFFIDSAELAEVSFPQWNLVVHGFSYHSELLPEARLDGLRAPEDGKRHILLAHGGDASHVPFRLNDLQKQGWDYVALGHLHKPGLTRDSRIAMPGSPEPLDHTETGRHGYFQGKLTAHDFELDWRNFSDFQYTDLSVKITPETTLSALEAWLDDHLKKDGSEAVNLTLKGFRDPELTFDPDLIRRLGFICEVRDLTEPDYPWEEWKTRPEHDLLARYIAALSDGSAAEEAVRKKALYYGIRALLSSERTAGSEVLR